MTTTTITERFIEGARIKVVQFPTAPREEYDGAHGSFTSYTSPHGYARITLDKFAGQQLVHPENLMAECICSVIGCGFYVNDGSDYCPSHY